MIVSDPVETGSGDGNVVQKDADKGLRVSLKETSDSAQWYDPEDVNLKE